MIYPDSMLTAVKRRAKGLAPSIGGAAAVEFALILPVLLIVLIGLIDYGFAMFNKMELRSAARAGAQYALGDSTDTSSITQTVVDASNLGISSSDVTLTCNCLDTSTEALSSTTCGATTCASSEPTLMTVSAAQSYTLFFGSMTLNLTGDATVRVK